MSVSINRRSALAKLSLVPAMAFASSCNKTGSGAESPLTVIKFTHCHQADFSSELHTSAWQFQQYVNDASETLRVKLYPSSALGQEREIYEGMQLGGGATCIVSGTAILNNFIRSISILDLPFLWRDYDHVHRVLDGEVGDFFSVELEREGFKLLAWLDSWGYRNVVTANRKVTSPDDLRGLKIRTIETPIYIAALDAMGVNATPMAFGEIYTSLQTGVLDGFEHNASAILANKYYEVAKHIVLTRHLFGPVVLVYSKADWDRLDEAEQTLVQEAAFATRDIERALAPIRERESLQKLEEHGMTLTEIDTSSFHDAAIDLQDRIASEFGMTELLEQIRSL